MVAKSIAKMYTNIHKPTDYYANVTILSTMKSSTMDFNVAKIASSARIITKSSTISLRAAQP